MPYYGRSKFRNGMRRKVGRRRRFFGPKSKTSWVTSAWRTAQKAYRGVNFIRSLINVEKFKADVSLAATLSNTAQVTSLNPIANGDGEGARTGNSILAKYLSVNFIVNRNSVSTTSADSFRVVIVRDNEQVADTAPAYTDVFSANSIVAPLNVLNVGRFTLLLDKRFYVSYNKAQASFQQVIPLNFHLRFNGTASTDIEKNGLWLMILDDASANHPSMAGNSRIAYYDN